MPPGERRGGTNDIYGRMRPVASRLTPEEFEQLAAWYADQRPQEIAVGITTTGNLGREL
jgi:cytochrome c553